ncbi:L-threonine dehydratase catabolic TdcB [Pseudovibrio axinellae]|uniref:L-threonine dehydratase catabolic TdcB n=1 Tax=Pseudovibrio axinellae TaxID=989403 RepID=A0A166APM9_9HYPH|nr:threonine/serine dehydratase [Pseudovibrio axinellae]KZL21391.1 L-threonine dehydratase catabolic TdcB [Pseudovibrio axinellae]SEQ98459.1 threonine dehydratase [Pseudovibrio axinellae]
MVLDVSSPVELTVSEIEKARARLQGYSSMTPLLNYPVLDERVNGRVFIKAENLQRTGSFKFRGAFNRLSLIPQGQRAGGVVACSSGNHAQGVAASAKILGFPAVIVMPKDAPELKIQRTKALGAEVILYCRHSEDREAIAHAICEERGATFIHPFNDSGVIVGQGTSGLEIVEQCEALGVSPDVLISCTGGGGLTSGIALALEKSLPDCQIYTAEPAGFDDYARSLESGERVRNAALSGSVCDAIMTDTPGEKSFAILKRRQAKGLSVSDEQAMHAVAYAYFELKLVVEPGAAVALASLLSGQIDLDGKTAVITISGGNVDPSVFEAALKQYSDEKAEA